MPIIFEDQYIDLFDKRNFGLRKIKGKIIFTIYPILIILFTDSLPPLEKSCSCTTYSTFPKKKNSDYLLDPLLYSAKVLEEHDTTHRYLKQTRYSKSLDHFQFSKENSHCSSLYNISDILIGTTKQKSQNNNIKNQKSTIDQNSGLSCNCYKNTSVDTNETDKKYQPVVVKQKYQSLVKSLSHTPSENTQNIFKSNSMHVLSPKLSTTTSNFDIMRNGCIQEDHEESREKEKEEQATIKRLIEMGECSSTSSTETASLIKQNNLHMKEALVVDFIKLRKVRSATCLGENASSLILNATESLPNISSTANDNLRYIDIINYTSSSSTCTSERSGWVSSRSSSLTSLETNKSNVGNGCLKNWSGVEKKLQTLTLDKITNGKSLKKYQKFDKSFVHEKGLLEHRRLLNYIFLLCRTSK